MIGPDRRPRWPADRSASGTSAADRALCENNREIRAMADDKSKRGARDRDRIR